MTAVCGGLRRARMPRRLLIVAAGVLAAFVGASASSAQAFSGPYAQFNNCPTSFPGAEYCIFGQITSGEVSIGKTTVPINRTITIQGGALPSGEEFILLPATNGESLSKTELNVPGGLLDLINCEEIKGSGLLEIGERLTCKTIFENGATGVTATTELVANTKNPALINFNNLFGESGVATTLPVRVHLKNPLLGEGCYIGSESSPIEFHLTTGTTSPPPPNKPIKGKVGNLTTEGEGGILGAELSLVDNSFSVPVAEGCGGFFSFLLDPIIDGKLGLPSASGNNTAIQNGVQKVAAIEEVLKHP